jgi:hypothetical protein
LSPAIGASALEAATVAPVSRIRSWPSALSGAGRNSTSNRSARVKVKGWAFPGVANAKVWPSSARRQGAAGRFAMLARKIWPRIDSGTSPPRSISRPPGATMTQCPGA